MKQVIIRSGKAQVDETPAPVLEANTVLVEVKYSCISSGTELAGVKMSGMPLWKRAIKQPENVAKVLGMVATKGISRTREVVKGQLAAGNATGYSAAGEIIEVGPGISHLKVGQRVACAGAQCAHHAQIISVPENLTVPIPDSVSYQDAATVTLGAIAMQGVRRANPTLGETFLVLGLGVLGQLTAQILAASGCEVIGMDLQDSRLKIAKQGGVTHTISPADGDLETITRNLTNGYGVDGVIITASSSSNQIVSDAFKCCRKKGRVVVVGDVGLDINRADIYAKELDFFISCSYGPGRYDDNYEKAGLDYPIAYVRWTENRNMASYLDLIAKEKLILGHLISDTYPLDDAERAYSEIETNKNGIIALLSYPEDLDRALNRRVENSVLAPKKDGLVKVAVVGAGGFAKVVHLPNLRRLGSMATIQSIVSHTGHNAAATAKQFAAKYATTEYEQALQDSDVDAVVISTRHDLHASMVMSALKAGKHVLVEKPMVMTAKELVEIETFYKDNESAPLLLTGYNRRFSPYMRKIEAAVAKRTNPLVINYRMNAGYIPLDHWVHDSIQGGGRNIGEACHIYDLFTYLTGSQVVKIDAMPVVPNTKAYRKDDNFIVNLSFADGSIAHLTYTAMGSKKSPKETMDIYFDGKIISMVDYNEMQGHGFKFKDMKSKQQDKGHFEELEAFLSAILQGKDWPIPLWQQVQAANIALAVQEQLDI